MLRPSPSAAAARSHRDRPRQPTPTKNVRHLLRNGSRRHRGASVRSPDRAAAQRRVGMSSRRPLGVALVERVGTCLRSEPASDQGAPPARCGTRRGVRAVRSTGCTRAAPRLESGFAAGGGRPRSGASRRCSVIMRSVTSRSTRSRVSPDTGAESSGGRTVSRECSSGV